MALKLREIYPTANRTGIVNKVTSEFIERLVTKVTAGFKGDVGVVPRQFLRQFVNILDLAAENDEFDPMSAEGFEPTDLNEVELLIREGVLILTKNLRIFKVMQPWSSSHDFSLCSLSSPFASRYCLQLRVVFSASCPRTGRTYIARR